jgi:hypothetical protein
LGIGVRVKGKRENSPFNLSLTFAITVFVTNYAEFAATELYHLEKTPLDFTILGLQINQLLPALTDKIKTED